MANHEIIKIRKHWGPISPITKIKQSDKIYDRKEDKEYTRREALRDYSIHRGAR